MIFSHLERGKKKVFGVEAVICAIVVVYGSSGILDYNQTDHVAELCN